MQAGIDDKLGIFVFMVSVFVISMCNAFYYGWRLTLVILTAVPVLVAILAAIAKVSNAVVVAVAKVSGVVVVVAKASRVVVRRVDYV